MTIAAYYTSTCHDPNKVTSRYVRLDVYGVWHWCEVGPDRRYDTRQGTADLSDIPADVRHKAHLLRGHFPSYVEWPFEETDQ